MKVKILESEANKLHVELNVRKWYEMLKQTHGALINVRTWNENLLKESANYVSEQEISASI